MNINESYNAMMQDDEFREFVEKNKNKSIREIAEEYGLLNNPHLYYEVINKINNN